MYGEGSNGSTVYGGEIAGEAGAVAPPDDLPAVVATNTLVFLIEIDLIGDAEVTS